MIRIYQKAARTTGSAMFSLLSNAKACRALPKQFRQFGQQDLKSKTAALSLSCILHFLEVNQTHDLSTIFLRNTAWSCLVQLQTSSMQEIQKYSQDRSRARTIFRKWMVVWNHNTVFWRAPSHVVKPHTGIRSCPNTLALSANQESAFS